MTLWIVGDGTRRHTPSGTVLVKDFRPPYVCWRVTSGPVLNGLDTSYASLREAKEAVEGAWAALTIVNVEG